MNSISDKPSIIKNLAESFDLVFDFYLNYPTEKYNVQTNDQWSAAQHLEHLRLSTVLLLQAMRLPRVIINAKFGKANRPLRTYDETIKRYHERLAQRTSTKTAAEFEPENKSDKGKALRDWKKCKQDLLNVIQKWSESDMDKYILPHPLMGKLIVREMLFFINHHTLQHLEILHDRYQ